MPRMDLKQNYRDESGVLFRAGKDREVSLALYDALTGTVKPSKGVEPSGGGSGKSTETEALRSKGR